MADETKRGVILYLAYSADGGTESSCGAKSNAGSVGIQLELFPVGNPSAVIFTNPKRNDLDHVLKVIERFAVKKILDLRDLPALNFERVSRNAFLDTLSKSRVEYLSFPALLGKEFEVDTISEFFHLIHTDAKPNWSDLVKNILEPLIRSGPTIVFTEAAPEVDEVAQEFAESLIRSNVRFSQVFANVH